MKLSRGVEFIPKILIISTFTFKRTCTVQNAVVIENFKSKEALAYCKECLKGYICHFTQLNEQSDEYFFAVRKFLFKYYPSTAFENYFEIINIRNND